MSTRATYLFRTPGTRDLCLYIHHDGYPSGAATYYALETIKTQRGQFGAAEFIRACERAEITRSHEAHGDTEYRYTFTQGADGGWDVAVYSYDWNIGRQGDDAKAWPLTWVGSIEEFIRKHAAAKIQRCGMRTGYYTHEMALEMTERKLAELDSYIERFPGYTGNIESMRGDAQRWAAFADSFEARREVAA